MKTGNLSKQILPSDHANHLCTYHEADQATVASAIDGALAAKAEWESMPWNDRAAIYLKAADLVSGKYRYKLMAATMLGQGKNIWQAEIDAAAEVRSTFSPAIFPPIDYHTDSFPTSCALVSNMSKSYTPNNLPKTRPDLGSKFTTLLIRRNCVPYQT